jgi:Flp pilus assembly protein TadG
MLVTKGTKGQGIVEFALIIMLLLIIAFGVFDLGRAFYAIITITNASREGARYLTLHPSDSTTGFTGTKNAAVNEAQGSSLTLLPGQVSVPLCIDNDATPGCDSGYPVKVSVTYVVNFLMDVFFSPSITLTRSTEMIVP